ncbi:DUF1289 domain-containing protein [Maricaulis sp. CAU 1757]
MVRTPVKTPCVQVCFVDPKAQICVGCFRTMTELGRWTHYSDAERDTIMAELPSREAAFQASRKTGGKPT